MPDAYRVCRGTVYGRKDRPNYVIALTNPHTGERKERSAGTPVKREAYKKAQEMAEALLAGASLDRVDWNTFCRLYGATLTGKSKGHQDNWATTKGHVERLLKPRWPDQLTDSTIANWQARLLAEGLRRTSVDAYSRSLRAALRWAKKEKLLILVPAVPVKKSRQRGRPLTKPELHRMETAAKDVRPKDWQQIVRVIRAVVYSGLRRSEVLRLSWHASSPVSVDLDRELLCFRAAGHKAGRDQEQAALPEFWALLRRVPKRERRGFVFRLQGKRGRLEPRSLGRIISAIGRKANVLTDPETNKYATFHDLRRTFAAALDDKGLTLEEKAQTMRHVGTQTVTEHYARREPLRIAAKLRGEEM